MDKLLKRKLKNGRFEKVPKKTSQLMSKIRGKNNKSTEMCLRMALIRNGICGWKCNYNQVIGKPDFFFHKKKLAVFVDGCYWHGCPICGHIPKTNTRFWMTKIHLNRRRDKKNNIALAKSGFTYLRIWEHDLKRNLNEVIVEIMRRIS